MARLMKSRRFLMTVGVAMVLALVWALGLWLGLGTVICLMVSCIILVLFSAYLVWDQARAAKNASNLERSLWEQSEEQKAGVRPEKREEIENLRKQLAASIQKLKSSKLGQGRRGAAALYALPWYMIIGPPAAGKTTAIRNSGLEFPFGTDREVQGVGGTRNCDWWFSNSAIILDTAGRYVTEDDDQEEWTAFLDILKKNRRNQPINGVLVCISVADLLNASNDDIEWHARTIRKRIDELTQRLGLRFPVYLVFTKCDLFNGFVQFFEDFSRTQREQIWGCTFNQEQLDNPNPRALFEQEYQVLHDGLVSARFARLSPGIKREDRSMIFAFPMEFMAAKDNLAFFVSRVFQPNPYQEGPVFRGFYFTSGTQEGVPIDRVIQSMAQAFGLAPQARQQFNPEIQAKSYFIKDLFTDVIIPDERLVRPTSRAAKSKRLFKVGAFAATILVLGIFLLALSQAYFRSKAELDATANDVTAFRASATTPGRLLPGLTALLGRINTLQHPPFFMFGMDRSQSLVTPLKKLYFRQVRPYVQSNILGPLEARLASPGTPRSESYDNLKAYLLLTTELDRLRRDEKDQLFLKQHLSKLMGPEEASIAAPHVDFITKAFPEAVEEGLANPFPANPKPIALARTNAGKLDVPGLYENLKRRSGDIPSYASSNNGFAGGPEVPGLYTIEGYRAMSQLIDNSDYLNIGDEAKWVLNIDADHMQGSLQNPAQISDSLRGMYYREYAKAWWDYISGLKIAPFENLSDAASRMRVYADTRNSPIKQLLQDVVRNTTLETAAQKEVREAAKKMGGVVTAVNFVENDFGNFHQFAEGDPEKGKAADIDDILAQLSKVSDELELLSTAPAEEAKVHAANVYAGSGPLAEALREIRRSSRAKDDRIQRLLSNLFEQPIRSSWEAVLERSADYLNDKWHRDVYEPYRQLAAYFPFDGSGQDAPLAEMATLFADNGTIQKFIDGDLKPFVDQDHDWEARRWEGMDGIALSPSAKSALNQAKAVKTSFFRGLEPGMKVSVKLNPLVKPDGATDIDKLYIKIGGKEQCWNIGTEKPPEFVFDWPGDGGASIRLAREGGKVLGLFGSSEDKVFDEKSFDGGWGLFRLVAASAKSPAAGRTDVRCLWTFKEGIVVTSVIKTDKGFNNPLARNVRVDLPEKLN